MWYTFFICVSEDGNENPTFTVHTEGVQFLSNLITDSFLNVNCIENYIKQINRVRDGEKQLCTIASEDAVEINVYQHKAYATDLLALFGFDKEVKIELDTIEFLNFLNNWLGFLRKYYNDEIPRLKYQMQGLKKE